MINCACLVLHLDPEAGQLDGLPRPRVEDLRDPRPRVLLQLGAARAERPQSRHQTPRRGLAQGARWLAHPPPGNRVLPLAAGLWKTNYDAFKAMIMGYNSP